MSNGDVDRSIQVSGLDIYPEHSWREAILDFLDGVWSDHPRVMYRPKIEFFEATLRLDPETGLYVAREHRALPDQAPADSWEGTLLIVAPTQLEVEQSLVRLVKNDRIQGVSIEFPNRIQFCLWKKGDGRGYGCWVGPVARLENSPR